MRGMEESHDTKSNKGPFDSNDTLTAETLITSIPFPKTPPEVPFLLPDVCAIFNCTGSGNVSNFSLDLVGRASNAVCPPNALATMVST